MPKTSATTPTPPTDPDPHALAPDTAASGTAGHAADSREAHTSATDGPAAGSTARLARAGDVEDRVWAALRRHPGATAAELASEASASRSAVGKLLAAWVADGSATSTPGSEPRAARRWTAAPTHDAPTTEPSTEPATTTYTAEPEDNRADEPATRTPDPVARPDVINAETADAISEAPPDSRSGNETVDAEDDEEPHRGADHEDEAAPDSAKAGAPRSAEGRGEAHNDEAHKDEADDAEVDAEVDAEADTEVDETERDGTATAGSEGGAPGPGAESATGRGSGRPRTATRNGSGSTRLAKGALRGQVEDYLAESPGEHSPVEIGKVLGRSSGAIANALEALVESGEAVRTSDQPRRYSHADHADEVDRTGSDGDDGAVPARGRTRTRGPGRGVSGVGTYVTVLAVLPLDSTGAISTDEIADWVRARMPEPVLFASAAHGVTRAALSAGADPSDWPIITTDDTTTDGATEEGGTRDDAADPTAGGEAEKPEPRAESGVGA